MASSINHNTIDGTYPVAGQDNDSQGFRDNFTNIRNNFSAAKLEIDELHGNVLVKNVTSFSGNLSVINNLNGTPFRNATISGLTEEVNTDNELGASSIEIDLSGDYQHHHKLLINANVATVDFVDPPADSKNRRVVLEIDATDANILPYTVELDSNLDYYPGFGVPFDTNTRRFTFAKTGKNWFEFNVYSDEYAVITPVAPAQKVNNTIGSNVTTLAVDLTGSGDDMRAVSANANVTISYSANVSVGKESKVFLRNLLGSNITVTLPNTLNNLGSNTFSQTTATVSTLVFTAMDTTNANVFCTIVRS